METQNYNNDKLEFRQKISYQRAKIKEQFKAIMIFIDKKGFMPIGEENE
jgi:hypothetical protein